MINHGRGFLLGEWTNTLSENQAQLSCLKISGSLFWLCDELCGLEIRSNDFLIRIVCFLRPERTVYFSPMATPWVNKSDILTVREGFKFNANIFLRTE